MQFLTYFNKLNVHHKMPFHIDQSLELNPQNLITLCRPHHYLAGHLMNWSSYNPQVVVDSANWLAKINSRP
jgi:hypothetical protein